MTQAIRLLLVSMAVLFAAAGQAQAGIITFEPDDSGKLPDGSLAADNLQISDQFRSAFDIVFGIDDDNDGVPDPGRFPELEKVGDERDGSDSFLNDLLGEDDVANGGFESRLGSWFLRTASYEQNTGDTNLLILYDSPVSAAAGEIWDIDAHVSGNEQWAVEALADDKSVLESVSSPVFSGHGLSSLNGKPWAFTFDRATADIHGIRLRFTGTKSNGLGVAFNNFSPASANVVPEPASLAIFGFGALGLVAGGRRRRKQKQAE